MREEPTIFINGRPFVLRDQERPFKNMREYTGITADTLERVRSKYLMALRGFLVGCFFLCSMRSRVFDT